MSKPCHYMLETIVKAKFDLASRQNLNFSSNIAATDNIELINHDFLSYCLASFLSIEMIRFFLTVHHNIIIILKIPLKTLITEISSNDHLMCL